MYDVFIQNYTDENGTYIETETGMFSVPIVDDDEAKNALKDPIVKTEMGKTGSFEFSLYPMHPFYNSWNQMKTLMRVVYDGDTLFRGRVLTIDNMPLTGEKKIHLEGDLAFLMDSVQPGVKEEDREEINILEYLQQLIWQHNDQMGNESYYKRMQLGEVPGQYTSATHVAQRVEIKEKEYEDEEIEEGGTIITVTKKKYGSDGWETTMNRLEALSKEYGGYFRTRWVGGTCYLDWLDYCFRYNENGQAIEIGENLIDLNSTTEVENLFTAVIPIGSSKSQNLYVEDYKEEVHGHNKRILVPQIVGLFPDSELNKGYHAKADYENAVTNYGIIYKTQQFPNADTQDKLWEYAIDWIKDNYVGGISSFTLSAMDMHHVDDGDENTPLPEKYLVGDRLRVIYPDMAKYEEGQDTPTIEKNLTLTNATYNLYHPEKNSYNVGVPSGILNRTYGKKKKSGGGGGGSSKLSDPEHEEYLRQLRLEVQEFQQYAWNYIASRRYNGDIYEQLYEQNPKLGEAALRGTQITLVEGLLGDASHPTSGIHKKRFQTMWLNGADNPKIEVGGPYDPTMQMTDEQLDAFNERNRVISFDGIAQKVGLRNALDVTLLDDHGLPKSPSELLTMKIEHDQQGKEMPLVKLYRSNKKYDNTEGETTSITGELGKIDLRKNPLDLFKVNLNDTRTYLDKDGVTQSLDGFVNADDFSTPDFESLRVRLLVVDELIAQKATIEELDAVKARIEELEAESITTDSLNAEIAKIPELTTVSIANGGTLKTPYLKLNGIDVSMQAPLTIVTGVTINRTSGHNFLYGSGKTVESGLYGTLVTSVQISTQSIHYVGYSENS